MNTKFYCIYSKQKRLNIINVFNLTFDQFNASLQNKTVDLKVQCVKMLIIY